MAGAFMLVFTAFLAVPLLLVSLGGSKYLTVLAILREGTGQYRARYGEGKFSQHYTVTVAVEADLAGAHIRVLADIFEGLRPFIGKVFKFATSEYESLVTLLIALRSHPAHKRLMSLLEERQHASQDSAKAAIDEEILLEAYRLKAAVQTLSDFLANHDESRVEDAA